VRAWSCDCEGTTWLAPLALTTEPSLGTAAGAPASRRRPRDLDEPQDRVGPVNVVSMPPFELTLVSKAWSSLGFVSRLVRIPSCCLASRM